MPQGLDDVSGYPALFGELAARGYADEDLQAIAGRNVLRLMRAAEEIASTLGPEAVWCRRGWAERPVT